MKSKEKTRFDASLTKEQKEFFEYAASIGGYRSLTEFVLFQLTSVQNKLLRSTLRLFHQKVDQEIFFQAISETHNPNVALENAAARYTKSVNS